MRLATVRTGSQTRAARIEEDTATLLRAPDLTTLLSTVGWADVARGEGETVSLDDGSITLGPLLLWPRRIVCVGLNYASHIREMGRELPTHPTLFAKFASSLIGPTDDIVMPTESTLVDWEVELGVVIGRSVRRASGDGAIAAIAGYTAVNDITARDWQKRTGQWLQGKAWDATTPVGPVMVTADEIDPDRTGAPDLEVRCDVDGVTRQRARTRDLVFTPGELVAYISTFTQLEPGDLIATGTPHGVGAAMDPPVTLEIGQTVTTTVQSIGTCTNTCIAA